MKEAASTLSVGMLTLLAASLLSAWVMGGFSSHHRLPASLSAQAAELGISVIDTLQMREIVRSGSHLILDARKTSDYDDGHIPTAFSVPVSKFEESFPMIAPMLLPDTPLVVYCSGPQCDDALRLIERMREAGVEAAVLYLEGMEGWNE
ncbi:MAG: rhodanese-like domain-containing protein [Kiritimatiellia bacterium]